MPTEDDNDEQVVSEHGDLCTIKDCCVVLCEQSSSASNPGRGAFSDRDVITRAFDAVGKSVEAGSGYASGVLPGRAYGLDTALRVTEALYALPIVYNSRLTRAIGRAKFIYDRGIPKATAIELTGSVEIPADYMHRLLVHEGCHVARAVIAQAAFSREAPHGLAWQQLMVGADQSPEATCVDPRLMEHGRRQQGGPEVELARSDFSIGDKVSFILKRQRVSAQIIQKSERAAIVRSDGGRWKVAYALLTKE